MPILDIFRNFSQKSELKLRISPEYFRLGHFDPYHNLNLVVNSIDITYGHQLLTSLLFFIPKSIWSGKGVGSGSFVADEANLYFHNISMPFVAEAFINFGLLGVVGFCLVLGVIVAKIDLSYHLRGYLSIHKPLYYMLLALFFFILRGDLMSALAYTIGITGAYITLIFMIQACDRMKFSAL
jgi:hypothetical protein